MSDRERRPAAPGEADFAPPVWNGEGFDPWLPARLRAAAEVAEAERRLFDGFWAALAEFLVAAARAVLGAPVPDATAVLGEQRAWERAMAAFVETDVRSVMEGAYIALFGPGVDFDARPAIAAHLATVQNQLVGVSDHVFDQVAATVARSAAEGWSIRQTAAAIDEVLSPANPYWRNRATVVARTTTIGALNAGRTDSFQAVSRALPDIVFEQQWVATLDARVRPSHLRADTQRVPVGGLFSVGGALLRFPGDPTGPPEEVIQCLVPGTEVSWPGQKVLAATRRRYSGPLLQLRTARGHVLTVTPNHPVMTSVGYRAAQELRPDDQIMTAETVISARSEPQVADRPTRVEQLYRALSETGVRTRVVGGRMDFHGDGVEEEEVDVVRPDRYLGAIVDSGLVQPRGNLGLVGLNNRPISLTDPSSRKMLPLNAAGGGLRPRFGPDRLPGGRGAALALLEAESRVHEPIGLGSAADGQPQLPEAADDQRTADAEFARHLEDALALGMSFTDVVEVDCFSGRHDVYNLSTADGWYIANGIVTHNCRCSTVLSESGDIVDLTDRAFRGVL